MSRFRSWVVVLAVSAAAVGIAAPRAWAWWSDTASGTGALTAYTVPAPTLSCGAFSPLTLSSTFSWTAVAGATSYTFYYTGGTSSKSVTGTSTSVSTAQMTTTSWVVANVNYGSTTWTSASSNKRSYGYLVGPGYCA